MNWANQTLIIPYMSASSLKITPFRAISNTLLHIFVVYLLTSVQCGLTYNVWVGLATCLALNTWPTLYIWLELSITCWVNTSSSSVNHTRKQVQYVALRKQQKRPGSRFFKEIGRNEMCQLAASLQAFRDLKVRTSIGLSHDKCKILTYFCLTGYLISHFSWYNLM